MVLRILAAVVGLTLICAGLVLSPVPWLAPVVAGGALVAFGLLSDTKEAP